jgi:hypothetical protein
VKKNDVIVLGHPITLQCVCVFSPLELKEKSNLSFLFLAIRPLLMMSNLYKHDTSSIYITIP